MNEELRRFVDELPLKPKKGSVFVLQVDLSEFLFEYIGANKYILRKASPSYVSNHTYVGIIDVLTKTSEGANLYGNYGDTQLLEEDFGLPSRTEPMVSLPSLKELWTELYKAAANDLCRLVEGSGTWMESLLNPKYPICAKFYNKEYLEQVRYDQLDPDNAIPNIFYFEPLIAQDAEIWVGDESTTEKILRTLNRTFMPDEAELRNIFKELLLCEYSPAMSFAINALLRMRQGKFLLEEKKFHRTRVAQQGLKYFFIPLQTFDTIRTGAELSVQMEDDTVYNVSSYEFQLLRNFYDSFSTYLPALPISQADAVAMLPTHANCLVRTVSPMVMKQWSEPDYGWGIRLSSIQSIKSKKGTRTYWHK